MRSTILALLAALAIGAGAVVFWPTSAECRGQCSSLCESDWDCPSGCDCRMEQSEYGRCRKR